MKSFFEKIPNWFVNFISIVSGIITVLTFFVAIFSNNFILSNNLLVISLCFIIICLLLRIRKIKNLWFDSYKSVSFNYHMLTHNTRDLYFDVMKRYKQKEITNIKNLHDMYEVNCKQILNHLCDILFNYCKQDVNACIKIITKQDDDIRKVKLKTFCRSSNSKSSRGNYEENNELLLYDNTDFCEIFDTDNNKNYFYQRNLEEYDKQLRKINKEYKNSNTHWRDDYIGTIVVPIQLKHSKLYNSSKEEYYNILGFVCVDSLSDSAFLERFEAFNTDIVKSFADLIYILLGQYKHYLSKL